ncbi:MAG: hypothetical protein J6V62_01905 [Paludibacteraceae bacterium]|nr:hypothetical protein [Paludibacteraceae bacterium]
MNDRAFMIAKERASKEVLSFLDDGYIKQFEVCFDAEETAIMKLRHHINGNTIKVRVCGCAWEVWKNGKFVKKEFV